MKKFYQEPSLSLVQVFREDILFLSGDLPGGDVDEQDPSIELPKLDL